MQGNFHPAIISIIIVNSSPSSLRLHISAVRRHPTLSIKHNAIQVVSAGHSHCRRSKEWRQQSFNGTTSNLHANSCNLSWSSYWWWTFVACCILHNIFHCRIAISVDHGRYCLYCYRYRINGMVLPSIWPGIPSHDTGWRRVCLSPRNCLTTVALDWIWIDPQIVYTQLNTPGNTRNSTKLSITKRKRIT